MPDHAHPFRKVEPHVHKEGDEPADSGRGGMALAHSHVKHANGCAINADPADGFGYCSCVAEKSDEDVSVCGTSYQGGDMLMHLCGRPEKHLPPHYIHPFPTDATPRWRTDPGVLVEEAIDRELESEVR